MNKVLTIYLLALLTGLNTKADLLDIDLSKAQCTGNAEHIEYFFPKKANLKLDLPLTASLSETEHPYLNRLVSSVYTDHTYLGKDGSVIGHGVAIGESRSKNDPHRHIIVSFITQGRDEGVPDAAHGGNYDEGTRTFTSQKFHMEENFKCYFPK